MSDRGESNGGEGGITLYILQPCSPDIGMRVALIIEPSISATGFKSLRFFKKQIAHSFQSELFPPGGEGGIRTRDTLAGIHAFQACALGQLCDLSLL